MKPTQIRWLDRYMKFCEAVKLSNFVGDYEKHHIIPSCVGGDSLPSNHVRFPVRAHFLAHLMLARAFKGHKFTGFGMAFFLMSQASKLRHPDRLKHLKQKTSRYYAEARRYSIVHCKTLKPYVRTPAMKEAISKRQRGMTPVTNGESERRIYKEKADEFLMENPSWYLGRSNAFRSKAKVNLRKNRYSGPLPKTTGRAKVYDSTKPNSRAFLATKEERAKHPEWISFAKMPNHGRTVDPTTGRFIKKPPAP